MAADLLSSGPDDGPVLVLAHGAGAPMDSEWMNRMADLLADRGIRVVRFEFGYMSGRRTGTRRPAPKAETVMDEYRDVVGRVLAITGRPVVIGGKSMGGRVASMVVDDLEESGRTAGLVCFGYPFHPPGAPERLRTAHLEQLVAPALICQGTRDPFGSEADVAGYSLSPAIELFWLPDGDHELAPRVRISGRTRAENLAAAADRASRFVRAVTGTGTTP